MVAYSTDGDRIGAAWLRFWTVEEHSYGFIDSQTPELGIAVRQGQRGRGAGTKLLKELLECARLQSIRQVSLNVEHDNPARNLYEKLGFRKVDFVGGSWTMSIRLDEQPVPQRGRHVE